MSLTFINNNNNMHNNKRKITEAQMFILEVSGSNRDRDIGYPS